MVQPKYVKVQFVAEWMGNPIGSKINMIESQANNLLQRGTVVFVDKIVKEPDTVIPESKQIDAPPMHRMIESPPVKKTVQTEKNPVKKAGGRPRKLK